MTNKIPARKKTPNRAKTTEYSPKECPPEKATAKTTAAITTKDAIDEPPPIAAMPPPRIVEALHQARALPPRTKVEVRRGLHVRVKDGNIPIITLHYSAHPERDPKINAKWIELKRPKYSSQGAWDREQEIQDRAGGGELVFADTLLSHWKKIVISDPFYRPNPLWRIDAGFDHGKTNPTAFERAYIDWDGCIVFCGEYYMPGKEIWEHAAALKQMHDVRRISSCFADPSIFPEIHQQSSREKAKSTNQLYVDNGFALFSQFLGDRGDISFAERLLSGHWANLGPPDRALEDMSDEEREECVHAFRQPTVRIVCRNYQDRPQPGLHHWDCPNLLWELMQTRKKKLSATQLMHQNPAEGIVDKTNHAQDAAKYLIMSLPEPSLKTPHDRALEAIASIPVEDVTSRVIRYQEAIAEIGGEDQLVAMSRSGRRRLRER